MTDVAIAAGCSQSTVSVILNRTPGFHISEATRQRVAEAVIALGYHPRPSRTQTPRGLKPIEASSRLADPGSPGGHAASYADQVARMIAIDIFSDRLQPGEALPSDPELTAEFGVSRTVLREAMKTLAGKGLIRARARIGTKVRQRSDWHLFDPDVLIWQAEAGLDGAFVAHLGEMRMMLEPEGAALAARRRTREDVELLRRTALAMGRPGISAEAFAKADLDFHLAVAVTAGNPFLQAVSTLIEVALIAAMTRSWPGSEPGGVARSAAAHVAIAEAIAAGDEATARAAMRAVIEEGTNNATGRRGALAGVPAATSPAKS